jgi:hypothetical protein
MSRCASTATRSGKLCLQRTLPAPVSGRVGLWSKADSYKHFDDPTITPAE